MDDLLPGGPAFFKQTRVDSASMLRLIGALDLDLDCAGVCAPGHIQPGAARGRRDTPGGLIDSFCAGSWRTRPRWTLQNRQLVDSQNRQFLTPAETGEFYFVPSSVRKSVWTFVRQLRGPHLSTWA